MFTSHVDWVPEQSPPHAEKTERGASALAVSVTCAPDTYDCVQSPGQLIPVPVTVPEPLPLSVTVNVRMGLSVNVAVTVRSPFIVTGQVRPEPPQAPVHPSNVESGSGSAVSVTLVPWV